MEIKRQEIMIGLVLQADPCHPRHWLGFGFTLVKVALTTISQAKIQKEVNVMRKREFSKALRDWVDQLEYGCDRCYACRGSVQCCDCGNRREIESCKGLLKQINKKEVENVL